MILATSSVDLCDPNTVIKEVQLPRGYRFDDDYSGDEKLIISPYNQLTIAAVLGERWCDIEPIVMLDGTFGYIYERWWISSASWLQHRQTQSLAISPTRTQRNCRFKYSPDAEKEIVRTRFAEMIEVAVKYLGPHSRDFDSEFDNGTDGADPSLNIGKILKFASRYIDASSHPVVYRNQYDYRSDLNPRS